MIFYSVHRSSKFLVLFMFVLVGCATPNSAYETIDPKTKKTEMTPSKTSDIRSVPIVKTTEDLERERHATLRKERAARVAASVQNISSSSNKSDRDRALQEIIDCHIENLGRSWSEIQTLRISGFVKSVKSGSSKTVPATIFRKRPNLFRIEFDYRSKNIILIGEEGSYVAGAVFGSGGMTGSFLGSTKSITSFDVITREPNKFEYIGLTRTSEGLSYKLRQKNIYSNGHRDMQNIYVDPSTCFVTRITGTDYSEPRIVIFSDYRPIGNYSMMPYKVRAGRKWAFGTENKSLSREEEYAMTPAEWLLGGDDDYTLDKEQISLMTLSEVNSVEINVPIPDQMFRQSSVDVGKVTAERFCCGAGGRWCSTKGTPRELDYLESGKACRCTPTSGGYPFQGVISFQQCR